MKRILILLLILAELLCLTACAGLPEFIQDPDLEILQVDEKEDNVVEDDDWDDFDAQQPEQTPEQDIPQGQTSEAEISEDGAYTQKNEVALYIHTYGHLPDNYITKKEAQALGWEGGKLEPYAPGKSIGGDYFGNYEGQLPKKKGRKYYECDIDTQGKKSRGSKRIVWSTDGLIYYTGDHYETFELLYGEPGYEKADTAL